MTRFCLGNLAELFLCQNHVTPNNYNIYHPSVCQIAVTNCKIDTKPATLNLVDPEVNTSDRITAHLFFLILRRCVHKGIALFCSVLLCYVLCA